MSLHENVQELSKKVQLRQNIDTIVRFDMCKSENFVHVQFWNNGMLLFGGSMPKETYEELFIESSPDQDIDF